MHIPRIGRCVLREGNDFRDFYGENCSDEHTRNRREQPPGENGALAEHHLISTTVVGVFALLW